MGTQTTGKQQKCRKVHGVEMRGLAVDRVSRGKEEEELRTRLPTFWSEQWVTFTEKEKTGEKASLGKEVGTKTSVWVSYIWGSQRASTSSSCLVGLSAPTYRGFSTSAHTFTCIHSFQAFRECCRTLSPEENILFPGCAKKVKVHMSLDFATLLNNY